MSKTALGSLFCGLAALIWGIAFVVMKNALDSFPVFWLLAIRFFLGGLLVTLIFHRKLRLLRGPTLRHGLLVGVILMAAYAVQTFGLKATTPGKNAFLTTVYCVLVPFIDWIWSRRHPDGRVFLAAGLCLLGIGLISLTEGLAIAPGDGLSLLCGVLYAFQVELLGRYGQEGDDPVALAILQLLTTGVLSLAMALCTEAPPDMLHLPARAWLEIAYLVVLSTALTMLLQTVGQSMTTPSAAGILLSLESVWGAVSSVLFYGEIVSPRVAAGFAVVFLAVLLVSLPGHKASPLSPEPLPHRSDNTMGG
jgi:drug/metabolite transporter (DMT)-like permease